MAAWRRLLLIRKSPFHPQCPCQAALRHGCHHCCPPGTLPPGAVNTAVGGGWGSTLAPHPCVRAARARRCRQRCALLWWCPLWCLKIGSCCGVFHASNPVQWNAVGPNSAGCPTARFLAFAVEKNDFRIFWGLVGIGRWSHYKFLSVLDSGCRHSTCAAWPQEPNNFGEKDLCRLLAVLLTSEAHNCAM